MHFAKKDGLLFHQDFLRAAKYFHFRAFNITFDKIWRANCGSVFVQYDRLHANCAVCSFALVRYDMPEATVGRNAGVRACEEHGSGGRPYRFFLHGNRSAIIPRHVLTKARGDLRIGFECDHSAAGFYNPRGQQGKKTNIGAHVIKNHSRA